MKFIDINMAELFPGVPKRKRSFFQKLAEDPSRVLALFPGGGLLSLAFGGRAMERGEAHRAAAHHFVKLLAVQGRVVPRDTASPYLSQRLKPAQGLSRASLQRHLQLIRVHERQIARPFTTHGLNLADFRRRRHFSEAARRGRSV